MKSSTPLLKPEVPTFDSNFNGAYTNVINNKAKVYLTVLFASYFALTLYRFLFPANLFVTSIVIGIGLTSLLYSISSMRKSHISIYIYIVLLIISHLISSLAVLRTERVGHSILFILSNTGIAMLLLKRNVYSWGGSIVFYLLAAFFFILILLGFNPDENLAVVSHNGISMLIIVACVTYYILIFLNAQKLTLIPAIITLVISIWGSGRSGILASFILLLGMVLIKYKISFKVAFLILVVLYWFFFLFFDVILMYSIDIPFLSNAASLYISKAVDGEPDVRLDIWQNYFNNLDLYRVVFGANVLTDNWPDGRFLAYNYHNTYINLHLQTGLMGLVTMLLFIIALIKFFFKNQIFFVLFFAVALRWFTDIGLYFESWDYIPFFFIFLALIGKDLNLFTFKLKN